MHYEAPTRGSVRHVLTGDGDFLPSSGKGGPMLEWTGEGESETLLCDGTAVVRLSCHDRLWSWRVLDGDAAPLRAGCRAEARQLAAFYALRRHAA